MSQINLLILFIACFAGLNAMAGPTVVSGGADNDYESDIKRLPDDRLVVVFDRNPDWASGDLYVTFSSDDGATWTPPQAAIVAAGDQATLSLALVAGDTLRVWYASNQSGTYGIYSAWSLDGLVWTVEGQINLGWSGVTHYDPCVAVEDDGSLTMSYIVSGSGVYVAHCPSGGTWDTDRTQVSSSGYRARIMKHSDGTYVCTYHKRTGGTYDYDVFVATSQDRIAWTEPVQLTINHNSHDPFVCEASDGAILVFYAAYEGGAYNLRYRRSYDALSWETAVILTNDHQNNTQPHAIVEGDTLSLVWAFAVLYPDDHDVYFNRLTYEPASCCLLRGDIDGSSVGPDIADLVYLVSYMFGTGPEPPCLEEADINGDGIGPDIADLVYLVGFMFQQGPDPVPCP